MAQFPDQSAIFNISDHNSFFRLVQETACYQFEHNQVYRKFCEFTNRSPMNGENVFLPVRLFKSHDVLCKTGTAPDITFTSSSTSGTGESKHHISDLSWYNRSFLEGFYRQFGDPKQYTFLGLLPSYLERSGSSLIYMVEGLMKSSDSPDNGFYLHDFEALSIKLSQLESSQKPTIVFGVTYALLDFAASFRQPLQHTKIIETGGMKGRKKEITREELHTTLQTAFQTQEIYSEYGMTELLSQAWSRKDGNFLTPPWMKIDIVDLSDPFQLLGPGKWGRICITDLANMHSCSFIATDDIGKVHEDGSFEIAGRVDFSDLRGCSLLYI